MKKEKIHLEYLLNATSKNILWSAISTPTGLEDWFADKVISDDKIVEFHWGKTELRKAEIIAIRSFSFIRFRWQDDENERDYFEIKMTYNELTLSASEGLQRDREVIATGSGIKVPVGDKTLGRLFNVLGDTVDDGPSLEGEQKWVIHRDPPDFDDGAPT